RFGDRIVDEVDVALFRSRARGARQLDRHLSADIGDAGGENALQQALESLAAYLGEGVEYGPPQELAVTRQLIVGGIHVLEDEVPAPQHRQEGRSVGEHLQQPRFRPLRAGQRPFASSLRPNPVGGVGDDVEERDDPTPVIADGAQSEGEPGVRCVRSLLARRGALDHKGRVLRVDRGPARGYRGEHRGDLLPDLDPRLRSWPTEGFRMLPAQHVGVRVVVDEQELGAAPEVDGEGAIQTGSNDRAEGVGPAVDRSQRGGRPIDSPRQLTDRTRPGEQTTAPIVTRSQAASLFLVRWCTNALAQRSCRPRTEADRSWPCLRKGSAEPASFLFSIPIPASPFALTGHVANHRKADP